MRAWPSTAERLISYQEELGALNPLPFVLPPVPRLGGCWICFPRGLEGRGRTGDRAWASAVTLQGKRVVDEAVTEGSAAAAYAPGLMALREGPLLGEAVKGLRVLPDVLLVNATGRDHPRRAGLALQLGAVLDLPTVGVTHRPLVATGGLPGPRRGDRADLVLPDGEVVGAWVRTRAGRRPLAVHRAWRTDLDTAIRTVGIAVRRARTPEPLRRARRVARLARAG